MNTGLKISAGAHAALLLAALIGWPFVDRSESATPQSFTVSLVSAQDLSGPKPEPVSPQVPAEVPEQIAALPQPREDTSAVERPETPTPVDPQQVRELPELGPTSAPSTPVDRVAPVPELARPEEQATDEAREQAAAPDPAATPEVDAPQDAQVPEAAVREIRPEQQDTPAPVPESAPPPRPTTPPRPEAPTSQTDIAIPDSVPELEPAPAETDLEVEDAIASALAEALTAEPEVVAPVPTGPPLTNGEREELRIAVGRCWNFASLSTDAARVTVVVGMNMSADGKPQADSIRMISYEGGAETAARSAYETARRAILRCTRDGYPLPTEKYDHWREIEMTFNPERMRGR